MNAYQLDFFEPIPDEIDLLRAQYIELFNRSENVRKGAFALITKLGKELINVKEEQERHARRLSEIESCLGLKKENNFFTLELEALMGIKSK